MSAPPDTWRVVSRLVRAAVRRRVPARDVDDVVQEALLRIHRGIAGLRDNRALIGWASAVAHGAVADYHRAQRPAPAVDTHVPSDDSTDAPLAAVVPFIAGFVELIPEPYRAAVRLTDLGHLTQAEAARALGVTASTLKSRVQRGRAHLRRELERCCEFEIDRRGVTDVGPRRARG